MNQGPDYKAREALALFADELSAHRYLEGLLWPNGVSCPHCGKAGKVGKLNGETTRVGTYKCYVCRKAFSGLHGTLMSSSHVPAHKWLQAIYLTEGGAKPMRPFHLHQILNVSFKTASSMLRRIGEAAAQLHYQAPQQKTKQQQQQKAPAPKPASTAARRRPGAPSSSSLQLSSAPSGRTGGASVETVRGVPARLGPDGL
jgi:transposase-like protein